LDKSEPSPLEDLADLESTETIRLLLADDHEVIRESLALMMSTLKGIEVRTTAADGLDALEKLLEHEVDIVLSDMYMPGLDGIGLALRLREHYPSIKVILLTMEEEPETIRTALQAGVWGYVLKKASKAELEKAVRTVAGGNRYYSNEVSMQLASPSLESSIEGSASSLPGLALSKREIEIVRLIVSDVPSQDIAGELFISPKTVETHRRNIFRKLGIHSVVALTRFALKHGIIR
jgi:DNA-binding NarL/FixJ family response regulator